MESGWLRQRQASGESLESLGGKAVHFYIDKQYKEQP